MPAAASSWTTRARRLEFGRVTRRRGWLAAMTEVGEGLEREAAAGRGDTAPAHDRRRGLRRTAHRAARLFPVAQGARGTRGARGPAADAGHPRHGQGRLVPDRQRLPHRQGALRGPVERCSVATSSTGWPSRTCCTAWCPDATLATATKYVKLLWGERANENLIKSINPLAEVEVTLDQGPAGRDTRYLEFELPPRQARRGPAADPRVGQRRDVAGAARPRAQGFAGLGVDAQLDMLLGILQVEPDQLAGVPRRTATPRCSMVNTVLRVPATRRRRVPQQDRPALSRDPQGQGRGDGPRASSSVESRAHAFEDLLQGLRDRPEL